MLRYIELKTGYNDDGPAWIGRVMVSRSGQTVYFNGKAFKKAKGGGRDGGNYFDLETAEFYWISGVKKNGEDRHWAGKGKIIIEGAAVEEYLQAIGSTSLDLRRFEVSAAIAPADSAASHERENRPLQTPHW